MEPHGRTRQARAETPPTPRASGSPRRGRAGRTPAAATHATSAHPTAPGHAATGGGPADTTPPQRLPAHRALAIRSMNLLGARPHVLHVRPRHMLPIGLLSGRRCCLTAGRRSRLSRVRAACSQRPLNSPRIPSRLRQPSSPSRHLRPTHQLRIKPQRDSLRDCRHARKIARMHPARTLKCGDETGDPPEKPFGFLPHPPVRALVDARVVALERAGDAWPMPVAMPMRLYTTDGCYVRSTHTSGRMTLQSLANTGGCVWLVHVLALSWRVGA